MRVKDISRYRRIWDQRMNKGMTFQEIGRDMGVSRQRVFQIYQRAYRRFKFGDPDFKIHREKEAEAAAK